MVTSTEPAYLRPYSDAVARHGKDDFRVLLWASPQTQEARFKAMVDLVDPADKTVLDLGCGKADLLEFMIARGAAPARYVGLEGVRELASAASGKPLPSARIIVADFVREPERMQVNADVIFCSGALNTLSHDEFYLAIQNAFRAAREALVFNFLSSSMLAGANYLYWHGLSDVMRFARTLTREVKKAEGYLAGDCTIALWKDR
jgi:SAM-dependent methyltransferase